MFNSSLKNLVRALLFLACIHLRAMATNCFSSPSSHGKSTLKFRNGITKSLRNDGENMTIFRNMVQRGKNKNHLIVMSKICLLMETSELSMSSCRYPLAMESKLSKHRRDIFIFVGSGSNYLTIYCIRILTAHSSVFMDILI